MTVIYCEHMKFLRDVENIVKDRLLPIWLFAFGILSILTTPTRLTDHTHEIQIIGSAWFRGGSIPLVQAFSNFGPLSLYIGSIYDRFITNSFTARLSEVALFSIISLLLYSWVKIRHANNVSYQNTLLILGLLIIVIPGVWQVGISSGKIGLVFLLGVYYFYDRWQQSSKSFWLFGETARNSRLLLGAGIMLSGLLFSSLLISLFALPVLISFIRTLLKDPTYGLRQAIVFLTPVALHGWLWYSYFASRGLVSEALRASILDFRLAVDGAGLDNLLSVALIFPIAVLILFVILAIRRGNYRSSRKTWVIGIALLLAIIGSSGGILLSLPFIFLLAVPLYLNNLRLGMVALWCGVGLAAVLPYRYLSSSQAKLESAQAQVATAYVEQRLIDTNYVLYYGNGAGFFKDSNLASSTRYYNSAVFAYDNASLQLVDKFRGDNEANTPRYVIYATSKESAVGNVPRIEEYFKKHYDEITALDGYKILKRR
jgi:hypothetical protein